MADKRSGKADNESIQSHLSDDKVKSFDLGLSVCSMRQSGTCKCQWNGSSLVHLMACLLFSANFSGGGDESRSPVQCQDISLVVVMRVCPSLAAWHLQLC